jgi:hypothetical protein
MLQRLSIALFSILHFATKPLKVYLAYSDAKARKGITKKRLPFKGNSEKEPVAANGTEERRAQNRRAELRKERGGDRKQVITIDFIKPIESSVVDLRHHYNNSA